MRGSERVSRSYDGAGQLTGVDVNCTTAGTTPPSSASTCTGGGTQDAATNLTTTYTYTTFNQLQDETDPLGRVTRHAYDANGNETSVIANYVAGQSATSERNVTTSQGYAANPAGNAGLPTSTTDPLGRLTTLTYDPLGRLLTEVLPGDGSIPVLTRTTTYDEFGNPLTETEGWTPLAGGSPVARTTSHVYDLANRETVTTDPALIDTTTGYDAAGNAISGSAAGVTTTRTFDGLGRVLTETTDSAVVSHTYDAGGNELTTSNTEGEATATTYTVSGWVLIETTDPGGLDLEVAHTYDALGRELSVTDQHTAGQAPLSTTTNTYDRTGRGLTSSTAGATSTTVYDRAGNVVAVKAPEGAVGATVFDPLDRPVVAIANCTNSGTTQPAPGSTCAGSGTVDASTNITSRSFYDATGATVAVTDPSGVATRTIVNTRGLASTTIAHCTDDGSTPPATTNPAGCTGDPTPPLGTNIRSEMTYDGGGAVVLTITAVGTGVAEATTETAYDAAGRVQAVKDPRGTISRSFYDPATGQQTRTIVNCTTSGITIPTDWVNCSGAGTANGTWNLATSYAYDASGNVTALTAPNGRLTTSFYDDAGRLSQRIDNDVASRTLPTEDVTTTYKYDEAGRQAAIIAPSPSGTLPITTRLVYDTDGTLLREIRNCTNSGLTLDPALEDPAACAATGTKNADTNVSLDYGYDAKGRRISVTSADPSATTGSATTTVTTQSAYDIADRLCRVVANTTGGTNLQTLLDPCLTATQGAGTTSANLSTRYTYGPSGMLASMIDAAGHTTSYAYDERGQLIATTDALNKTIVWAYDPLGRRIRQENRADPPFSASVAWTYDGAGRIATRLGCPAFVDGRRGTPLMSAGLGAGLARLTLPTGHPYDASTH